MEGRNRSNHQVPFLMQKVTFYLLLLMKQCDHFQYSHSSFHAKVFDINNYLRMKVTPVRKVLAKYELTLLKFQK